MSLIKMNSNLKVNIANIYFSYMTESRTCNKNETSINYDKQTLFRKLNKFKGYARSVSAIYFQNFC